MDNIKKNLELTKDILDRRYSISDDLYGIMFLVCYGLIAKFGEVYSPIIKKVIQTTEVWIDDKPLVELLDEGGYGADSIYNGEDLENDYFSSSAASFPGDDIWFEDGKVRYYRNNPELFCSTTGKSFNEILNSIIHEFCHLVKGSINYLKIDDEKGFSIRSGLNVFGGEIDEDGELKEFSDNLILDEVINVFQTTDAMIEIGKIPPQLLPEVVKEEFRKLDLSKMNELYGYDYGTYALKDLWANEHFRGIVEDNIIMGKLDSIRDEFNQVVGRNYFKLLSSHLNLLEYAEDEEEQRRLTNFIRTIVRIYNLRTKYIQKRKD